MKNLVVLLFPILLVSCSKDSEGILQSVQQETTVNQPKSINGCFTEEEFMSIAEGFTGFWSEFRDTSIINIQTKLENLSEALNGYPDTIPLRTLALIYEQELLVDSSSVAAFLSTLVEFKDIISTDGFSQCFYDELVSKVGEEAFTPSGSTVESRWFLATLAAALGAGPCVTGPLAVIDTSAYIATGVLTAPTGIGAVANWGGAVASYGYALSTIGEC